MWYASLRMPVLAVTESPPIRDPYRRVSPRREPDVFAVVPVLLREKAVSPRAIFLHLCRERNPVPPRLVVVAQAQIDAAWGSIDVKPTPKLSRATSKVLYAEGKLVVAKPLASRASRPCR